MLNFVTAKITKSIQLDTIRYGKITNNVLLLSRKSQFVLPHEQKTALLFFHTNKLPTQNLCKTLKHADIRQKNAIEPLYYIWVAKNTSQTQARM